MKSETELRQALWKPKSNLWKISPGLELFVQEFPAGHGRKIDILCRYTTENCWVAIELKANKADHRVFGQMLIYLLFLKSYAFAKLFRYGERPKKLSKTCNLEWILQPTPGFWASEE